MNYREHLIDNLRAALLLLALAGAHILHGLIRTRWTAALSERLHWRGDQDAK